MKVAIILLYLTFLSFSSSEKVYVCISNTSVAYHRVKTCRGLYKCTHEIIAISVKEAEYLKKRECKICY